MFYSFTSSVSLGFTSSTTNTSEAVCNRVCYIHSTVNQYTIPASVADDVAATAVIRSQFSNSLFGSFPSNSKSWSIYSKQKENISSLLGEQGGFSAQLTHCTHCLVRGRQPSGAVLHSSCDSSELSQWHTTKLNHTGTQYSLLLWTDIYNL